MGPVGIDSHQAR